MKYRILPSTDGKCPYCGSDFIFEVGEEERKKIQSELPDRPVKVWKCYTCNKYFYTEE
jgi:uncharacterized protein with PIN domain